ncbi:MAG: hypothetical protein GC199_09580 [Alphaproteobacteria bacterium]|nr:hypothetical protein [Alphaproteobacteria bacterium]
MMMRVSPLRALCALALAVFFAEPALAQETAPAAPVAQTTPTPLILVVDRAVVMRQSAAGKDIVGQVEAYGKKMEEEFGPEEAKIRADAKQLQEQASVLDPKVREQRQKGLRDRQAALQQRIQERQAQIQGGVNKARQQVAEALEPILKEIMIERGANLLLDRGVVVLGAIDVDVTGSAIQRLDESLPKVQVELVEVPKPMEGEGSGQ